MAKLTHEQLDKLEKIAELVDEICGPRGKLVACDCLDKDDGAPHHLLCAWDTVSLAMEQLWLLIDSTPSGMLSARRLFSALIGQGRFQLRRGEAP